MSKFEELAEFVLLGTREYGYTLPYDITPEEGRELVSAIDSNEKVINLVRSQNATAADIWKELALTSIGETLLSQKPGIARFRISGERKDRGAFRFNAYNPQVAGDEKSTTEMHRYDTAAQIKYKKNQEVPSFREFYDPDPDKVMKYRPEEVSGASTKQK